MRLEKELININQNEIENSNMFIALKSKELKALSIAVISGNKNSIKRQVKRAYNIGASRKEIFRSISDITNDKATLRYIRELINSLRK